MFIGWMRERDIEEFSIIAKAQGWITDIDELYKLYNRFPHLFYSARDGNIFAGAISGYLHENTAWIGNFLVKESYRKKGIGKRLFETLLTALKRERESIYLNSAKEMVEFYKSYGFEVQKEIGRFEYDSKQIAFKFNSSQAKELEKLSFGAIAKKIDLEVYKEERSSLLNEDIFHKTSLKFATANGFQHSRAYNSKNIFLGPWEVKAGAYMDAERLMRALLYYRGAKKIFADVPMVETITSLYKNYNFKQIDTTYQMVLGKKQNIKYEDIYAFATTGICG